MKYLTFLRFVLFPYRLRPGLSNRHNAFPRGRSLARLYDQLDVQDRELLSQQELFLAFRVGEVSVEQARASPLAYKEACLIAKGRTLVI